MHELWIVLQDQTMEIPSIYHAGCACASFAVMTLLQTHTCLAAGLSGSSACVACLHSRQANLAGCIQCAGVRHSIIRSLRGVPFGVGN